MAERDDIGTSSGEAPEQTHGTRVYVYFVLIALMVLTAAGLKMRWQRYTPVKQVVVEGTSVLLREEIVRLMDLQTTQPMYEIDLTAVQRNILSNSFVQSAVIQRDPPAALRVTVVERKPAAILNAGELYYLSEDGTVLPYIASEQAYDIPVISGFDSVKGIRTGQRLEHADVREALDIITASRVISKELFHSISEIRLRKGKDLVLYTFETGVPIIFGKGDAAKKMVKLDAFWQQFMQGSTPPDIRYIDIRFDDQVVVSRKDS
ncbi:MAG: FtsQ-type POTRA domain-containing protein [Bacteroidetes bacterium]|nr:FtsQ-type POTRA domain-containing protein [Bacteroidota bacterium]